MKPAMVLTDSPPPQAFEQLWARLLRFNEGKVGNAKGHTLAILLSDPTTHEVIGGLWGRSLWGSMMVDILFVPASLRRAGIGSDLMRQAEEEAIRRGCHGIWLDTFDFQARHFYERLGYTVFGRLEGPAPMFPRFFLKKDLAVKGPATTE
jgi:GNAT superfamily N-acetyltransferase